MNYVDSLNLFGVKARQTSCIKINGAPTATTKGAVGVLAINIDSKTKDIYKCTAVNEDGTYAWEILSSGNGERIQIQADLNQNDETQPDYIKNRTHYTEEVNGEEIIHPLDKKYLPKDIVSKVDGLLGGYMYTSNPQYKEIFTYENGNNGIEAALTTEQLHDKTFKVDVNVYSENKKIYEKREYVYSSLDSIRLKSEVFSYSPEYYFVLEDEIAYLDYEIFDYEMEYFGVTQYDRVEIYVEGLYEKIELVPINGKNIKEGTIPYHAFDEEFTDYLYRKLKEDGYLPFVKIFYTYINTSHPTIADLSVGFELGAGSALANNGAHVYYDLTINGERVEGVSEPAKEIVEGYEIIIGESTDYAMVAKFTSSDSLFHFNFIGDEDYSIEVNEISVVVPIPNEFVGLSRREKIATESFVKGYVDENSGSIAEIFDYTKYPLPVLYLDGDISTMTKEKEVTLTYKYKDMEGTADVKWQGSSSLAYPKKNYTVEFDTGFIAKEGWGEQKKYVMKANWIDFSHSRNIAAAKVWGECIRRYEHYIYSPFPLKDLPNGGAVDGFPIVVVINGEYQGLYAFSIPKDGWMLGMDDSNVNHCIIGASGKNDEMCGFKTMPVIDDDEGFEYEYISDNATDTDKARFQTTIQNLYTALQNCKSRADLENNVGIYLDLQKAVVYMLYTAYIGNYDGITKNYLLVTTNGQKWHMSAYDLDSTFGNNPYGNTYYYAGQYTLERVANSNMIFKRIYEFAPDLIYSWYEKLYALGYASIDNEFYKYAVNIPKIYFDEEVKLWKDIPGTNTNNLSQIMSFYKANAELINTEIEKLKADKISVTFKNGEYGGSIADVSTIGFVERSNNIWGGQTANI